MKKIPLLYANNQVLLPNQKTKKNILSFIKKVRIISKADESRFGVTRRYFFQKYIAEKDLEKNVTRQSGSHEHRQIKMSMIHVSWQPQSSNY